jgi:hypothetical protein
LRDVPFMISIVKKEELEIFSKTEYSKLLDSELANLVLDNKITVLQKDLIISIKAREYYSFCIKGNAWVSVKYYLEHFPELFKIHDLLLIKEKVEKFFFIINSKSEGKFEQILNYKKLNFEKYQRKLNDGRELSIYIGYLLNPKQYTLNENPVRNAFSIAEDAGIRIGYHYYPEQEEMYSVFHLALIRSFPVELDEYGDFSRADGGFREDLKAGFKSSWEANIARVLNYHNLEWEYEKASESYGTEIGAYIPDFKVTKSGKTFIIEVKGLWDDRSVKKVWSAMAQQKDEEIIIIDSDYYNLLDTKFSETIPNWENTKITKNSFVIPVIGVMVGKRLTNIETLNEGELLKFIRESDNPYDSNAIKIVKMDNSEIGYIAKEWASIFAYKIDRGFSYEVRLKRKELAKKRILVNFTSEPSSDELLNKIDLLN